MFIVLPCESKKIVSYGNYSYHCWDPPYTVGFHLVIKLKDGRRINLFTPHEEYHNDFKYCGFKHLFDTLMPFSLEHSSARPLLKRSSLLRNVYIQYMGKSFDDDNSKPELSDTDIPDSLSMTILSWKLRIWLLISYACSIALDCILFNVINVFFRFVWLAAVVFSLLVIVALAINPALLFSKRTINLECEFFSDRVRFSVGDKVYEYSYSALKAAYVFEQENNLAKKPNKMIFRLCLADGNIKDFVLGCYVPDNNLSSANNAAKILNFKISENKDTVSKEFYY